MPKPTNSQHPGIRIKTEVIPLKMSVTKAAQLIGVGRPALSNLLNGNAALSPDMAARLSKAFNYPLSTLMEMQARYDSSLVEQTATPANTKKHVPPFLAIKANAVEDWVSGNNITARSRLAVFLRTLVNSTGHQLTKVDFPGNDDAERPGWDGVVEAGEGTPWIPFGKSGWEFGTNSDPKTKANKDFDKSVKAYEGNHEHAEITFVFVSPRRWKGKEAWIKEKTTLNFWKDVRAYDASDIEQWLEQSLPAQAWFANETQIPAPVRSLDKCWSDWANVCEPPISPTLFNPAIEATKRKVLSLLSKPAERPILIATDSIEEALAYLSQLLSEHGDEVLASYRDSVLVFDETGSFPRLAMGAQTFIAVAYKREVEREFATYSKTMHTFAIYPRNALTTEPDIVLEPVNYLIFNKALEEMSMNRDDITRFTNESGRSLTVLRRRLSSNQALRTPEWAQDSQTARQLIPFLLVGTWDSRNENDKLALSRLAGDRSYDDLEREFQLLTQPNDAPVWSIDSIRGVISKIDLLFAIAYSVTSADLTRYFEIARLVLGEDDPSLDLEEGKRWAANVYGKTREFSSIFRKGISETLVLLAVNGTSLFKKRLGFDAKIEIANVVRDLLPTPLTARALEANNYDLSTYAEAAPDAFLSILEDDLKSEHPAALELMRPVLPGIFGNTPSRSGLLWALESLSWNPDTLLRATCILARLSQVLINDNWSNKPINSLKSIYRSWMPQTAANHQQRVNFIKILIKEYPDIAWELCLDQFGNFYQTGEYTQKPRWRPDGYGFGEPLPEIEPINAFVREMVEIALTWHDYSMEMLSDLVIRLNGLSDQDQDRVWTLIENWANTKASDDEKVVLREQIRVSTLSRTAVIRAQKMGQPVGLTPIGSAAYKALEPSDLLNKHAWLFRETWVAESADEIEEIDDLDFVKRGERINKLRSDALREVLEQRGLVGILELAERGNASWAIGDLLVTQAIVSEQSLQEIIRLALLRIINVEHESISAKNLISAALHAISDKNTREALISAITTNLQESETIQLFLRAPFCQSTWKLIDELSEGAMTRYWEEVTPPNLRNNDEESREAVERLLKAERPRAAFWCIQYHPEQLDSIALFRLLTKIAQGAKDKPEQYMLDKYRLKEAFKLLNSSSDLTLDQKAGLEFAYIDALGQPIGLRSDYGIPNLERYIQDHPEFFAHAVAWIYKRKDDQTDPEELQLPPEQVTAMAQRCYKLLGAIARIPGRNEFDELDTNHLAKWVTTVRQLSSELGRTDIADNCIGKILSQSPMSKDDAWPCEQVRDVLEDIRSERLIEGVRVGVYNSRGTHWRGEGGNQERELAEKYRKWGLALQISHPFVSSKLLMALANGYEREADREDVEENINQRIY